MNRLADLERIFEKLPIGTKLIVANLDDRAYARHREELEIVRRVKPDIDL